MIPEDLNLINTSLKLLVIREYKSTWNYANAYKQSKTINTLVVIEVTDARPSRFAQKYLSVKKGLLMLKFVLPLIKLFLLLDRHFLYYILYPQSLLSIFSLPRIPCHSLFPP